MSFAAYFGETVSHETVARLTVKALEAIARVQDGQRKTAIVKEYARKATGLLEGGLPDKTAVVPVDELPPAPKLSDFIRVVEGTSKLSNVQSAAKVERFIRFYCAVEAVGGVDEATGYLKLIRNMQGASK